MQQVISALDKIRLVPGANVDSCFLQGRDAMLKLLNMRDDTGKANLYIDEMIKDTLEEIQEWVEPYQLPESYRFFLAFCGGLYIDTNNYGLFADGIGPMVEEWYSFLMGDEIIINPSETGFFQMAMLSGRVSKNERYPYVYFFLDLVGVIQQYAVIGVGPYHGLVKPVLQNLNAYQDHWKVVAPSFPEWLELVAATNGSLDYM